MAKDQDGYKVPHKRAEERPTTLSQPIPREKLPSTLQSLIDREDDFLDQVYDGQAGDTTDSSLRYAAYTNRLRTIMLSAQRYVAYTSDVGESFRPIAHPYLVRGAYAVSWAYLIGDVSHEGYKAYCRNNKLMHPPGEEYRNATEMQPVGSTDPNPGGAPVRIPAIEDYRSIMVQRAVFQSLASMGLPAFTIHSIVKYSGKALKNASNKNIRTWGPVGLGLAAVPALPFLFDKPVEEAVEWTFHTAFRAIGGEAAVGNRPATGREHALNEEVKQQPKKKAKEKEL